MMEAPGRELIPVGATVLGTVLLKNMAIGFAAGMIAHYLVFPASRKGKEA